MRAIIVKFACRHCNTFVSGPSRNFRGQKYCSLACWYQSKDKHRSRVCIECGVKFTNSNPLRYCSRECHMSRIRKRKSSNCQTCGEEFQRKIPSDSKKYCSRKCMFLGATSVPRTFECLNCAKVVTVPMVRSRPRTFCSAECQRAYLRHDKHPLYRGNRRQDRGPTWRVQSKLARERDENVCQGCGVVPSQKASVDHIVPYRMAVIYGNKDGVDPNHLLNLISLCRSCHGKKTRAEARLLKGDMVGFRDAVRAFMPAEKVELALSLWRIR